MAEMESQDEKNEESKRHKPKGHKGLYKRGNVWWLRYVGVDGRIIREFSRSSKFKEADDLLIQRRNEIKEGKQPEIKKRIVNHTFKELAAEYKKRAERQGLSKVRNIALTNWFQTSVRFP